MPSKPVQPLSGRVITVDPGHNGGNFTHPLQIGRLVNDGNGEKECDTTGSVSSAYLGHTASWGKRSIGGIVDFRTRQCRRGAVLITRGKIK